jgi:CRP/FNR family transcriptional regulator, nitrogen fixation regulation protein
MTAAISVQTPRTVTAAYSNVFDDSITPIGIPMLFTRRTEIYGEKEPAERIFKVLSGAVCTYTLLKDGRRQVDAFYLPGDLFGLEIAEEYTFPAKAVVDCQLLVIQRSALSALVSRDSKVARQLYALTAAELKHAQNHMILLIKTAEERIVAFLLEMSERSKDHLEIDLPMSRQDIADYLGLTIETVSRALTELREGAAISVPTSHRILLHKPATLRRLND